MRKKEYQQACAELEKANQQVSWLNTQPSVDPNMYQAWLGYQQHCSDQVAIAAQMPSGFDSFCSFIGALFKILLVVCSFGLALLFWGFLFVDMNS